MSWEDCGFKPGKIHGDARCARQCGDCDGEHHFYVGSSHNRDEEDGPLPDGINPDLFFECKHCGVFAEAVDEDEEPERLPEQRRCACPRTDAHECYRVRYPGPALFDEDEDEDRRDERCECACHAEIRELEPEPWEVHP